MVAGIKIAKKNSVISSQFLSHIICFGCLKLFFNNRVFNIAFSYVLKKLFKHHCEDCEHVVPNVPNEGQHAEATVIIGNLLTDRALGSYGSHFETAN
jgi:hypothetical protein